MKRIRRPLVVLLAVGALGSSGLTQVAQARIARNVECQDHTFRLDRHFAHTWRIRFKLESMRPHTTTVVGRWVVKTDHGTRHYRYHAELGPGEVEGFSVGIPLSKTSKPSVNLVGCR